MIQAGIEAYAQTEDFTYNNILVTEGTSANSWDPEDLSWFTDQLAIAQAAGPAAEAFFKKHAVGIVTTEHDMLAVSITNWGNFASHIGAYKLVNPSPVSIIR